MKDSRMPSAETKFPDGCHPAGFICHLRSPERAVCSTEYLERLVDEGHVLACCPVNFTEVYAGLREGEEDKTATFLNSLEYLPVTSGIARQAGLLRRD